MRLCHPPDGSTSPKYKFLCFITTKKALSRDRCCHLVLCLRLIPFHCVICTIFFWESKVWIPLSCLVIYLLGIGVWWLLIILHYRCENIYRTGHRCLSHHPPLLVKIQLLLTEHPVDKMAWLSFLFLLSVMLIQLWCHKKVSLSIIAFVLNNLLTLWLGITDI